MAKRYSLAITRIILFNGPISKVTIIKIADKESKIWKYQQTPKEYWVSSGVLLWFMS